MDIRKHLILSAEESAWKERWRRVSWMHRLQYLSSMVVPHPKFVAAVSEIKRRVKRCVLQNRPSNPHKKGAAMTIIAPTGAGKSHLTRYIENLWPDRETEVMTLRRVVIMTVPPSPTRGSMNSALLKALGDPKWNVGDIQVREERAIFLLKKCRTRVVLIDNIHDVPERRTRKGVREVGNWVRTLIDSVPALFVTLGDDHGLEVMKANSQARRRNPAHIRFGYFECGTATGLKIFLRFLYELDKRLPLAEMCGLAEIDIARRLWMASNGITDYIIGLLTEAIDIAVRAGRDKITQEDFQKAFESYFLEAAPEINPFAPDTPIRRLDGEGEPFHQWLDDGYE